MLSDDECFDTVPIFVYFPGQWILKASVLKSASTKDLAQFMPEKDITFIHNGVILNSTLPFGFYEIKPSDIIICVRNRDLNTQWLSLTNRELVHERVSEVMDPQVSYELAKLRDLQMLRIERKPKLYRKMCIQLNEETETKTPSFTLLIPPKPKKPSDSPLPLIWSTAQSFNSSELMNPPVPSIEESRNGNTESIGTN